MKKFVAGLLLLLLASVSYGQDNNDEFRANWVITWEHSSSGYSAEQGKARIREILDNQKAGNFNAVLWQARQGAMRRAVRRLDAVQFGDVFRALSLIDRQSKGRASGDPWQTLDRVVRFVCDPAPANRP